MIEGVLAVRPIEDVLRERFIYAMGLAFGSENVVDPLIKTADPMFADYQSNVAMGLAKKVSLPPREVATAILKRLELSDMCEAPTIAGPGFINIKLKKEFLVEAVTRLGSLPREGYRAGVDLVAKPDTVVIDYSGPNVAKQMHVGHLRSTIIGDTVARVLDFLGHKVVRQNHIGDFGTQFGMLIHHLREKGLTDAPMTIADLDTWYKEATERFKNEPAFAEQARKTVVELQSGSADAVAVWNRMRVVTHGHYTEVYKILNVQLTDADERGESFYGTRLPVLVERLKDALGYGTEGTSTSAHSGKAPKPWEVKVDNLPQPMATEARHALDSADALKRVAEAGAKEVIEKPFMSLSDGAWCVFLPGYVDREGDPLPLMVQKSDGGFPYSATDLAALYFRVQEHKTTAAEQKPLNLDWHGSRVIYLTDTRQAQHFAMVFDAFRAARWDHLPDDAGGGVASLEHAPFGAILGEDRKPYKTRSGKAVALLGFLEEAIEAAAREVAKKNPDLAAEKQARVAQAVGIAAVKYADLRNDRTTDYVFSPEQMVAFEGNTGPYLQYAYTRVRSIFRKSGVKPEDVVGAGILLESPAEVAVAKALLRFPGVLQAVARDLKPHFLCAYLYELATTFSSFYEACPVNDAPDEQTKRSRLLLCDLVARTLGIGLEGLLGIEALEEM